MPDTVDTFAACLRRLLDQQNISFRALAGMVFYSKSYLNDLANGRKAPTPEAAQQLDIALHADGHLHTAAFPGMPRHEVNTVNRRNLIVDLTALSVVAPFVATETVRHALAAALTSRPGDEWETIAIDYGRSFYLTPPGTLLRDITADVEVLAQQIARDPHLGLYRAAAHLAAIAALAWASAGEHRHASRWWGTARTAADRACDPATRVWARGWEVANGLYEDRPTDQILHRAAEATTIAGQLVTAGSAGLYAGLAQTLAATGRTDAALAALNRVEAITDLVPADVARDETSMFGWPEVRLRHTQSYVHTCLGNTTAAYAAQDRALALYPQALVRERAAMLMHRAACMVRDGDVGGGITYAAGVLDDLPAEHHTDLVYAVGRAMMAAVPGAERHRPAAAELADRLAIGAGPR